MSTLLETLSETELLLRIENLKYLIKKTENELKKRELPIEDIIYDLDIKDELFSDIVYIPENEVNISKNCVEASNKFLCIDLEPNKKVLLNKNNIKIKLKKIEVIDLLQSNTTTGTLVKPGDNDASAKDWRLDAVAMFKAGKIKEARTLICGQAAVEDMDGMYRWMYDNLDLWSSTDEGQDEAILIIRKGLVNVPMVADQEINLSATLVELAQIG